MWTSLVHRAMYPTSAAMVAAYFFCLCWKYKTKMRQFFGIRWIYSMFMIMSHYCKIFLSYGVYVQEKLNRRIFLCVLILVISPRLFECSARMTRFASSLPPPVWTIIPSHVLYQIKVCKENFYYILILAKKAAPRPFFSASRGTKARGLF